jgi:SPX domain protein involved in polyphosphate accumulation
VTQFLAILDIEIKKVYHLFTSKERELYVSINSHLHIRNTYETFNVKQITKELEELWKISLFALNITKFVSYNIHALKTILNKFDKHFEKNYGRISSVCARNIIQSKNADLLYILQFKVTYINLDNR